MKKTQPKTIRKAVAAANGDDQNGAIKKFGTFGGVFTPTVLTILGVIMYLRLGWVVGNAGFLGAVAIITLAKLVTLFTALSMSSITTNIKIGAGGAYSIISKSLGLEAGGSIGIPFYMSQSLSAALYIIGFAEGWIWIFPDHPPFLVAVITWLVLLGISYKSAHFAIRIQFVILVLLAISLVSFMMTSATPMPKLDMIGYFEKAGFWQVFAIFFPAVTGIMAGANMSGDLAEPRDSIPKGTLWAIAITYVVYIGLAWLLAVFVPSTELISNQMAMVDYAFWGPAVVIGILAATFSSALGTMLGAPRILQALAEHKTVPMAKFFAIKSASNEPRNAIIFTGGFIMVALALGNLDALATLITMFFLITYGMLNFVVFIQQTMKIISFRPTFSVPRFVPLLGGAGCVFMMFLINPIFSAVAITLIIVLYSWLVRMELKAEWGDLRGGIFITLAERASRIAAKFPRHQISWKPDLLIPIDKPDVWTGPLLFIKNLTAPSGSIFAFTVDDKEMEATQEKLDALLRPLKEQNLLVNSTVIEDATFQHGAKLVIQTLRGGAFRPNTLFLTLGNDKKMDAQIAEIVATASKNDMGTLILRQHPRVAFGMQKDINLWLRDKSPNWHLGALMALQLRANWEGTINMVTVAESSQQKRELRRILEDVADEARMPSQTEFHVLTGPFQKVFNDAPSADINIFGLAPKLQFEFMRKSPEKTQSTCLFVKDSGFESALV